MCDIVKGVGQEKRTRAEMQWRTGRRKLRAALGWEKRKTGQVTVDSMRQYDTVL